MNIAEAQKWMDRGAAAYHAVLGQNAAADPEVFAALLTRPIHEVKQIAAAWGSGWHAACDAELAYECSHGERDHCYACEQEI